jgi:hypothetical protein
MRVSTVCQRCHVISFTVTFRGTRFSALGASAFGAWLVYTLGINSIEVFTDRFLAHAKLYGDGFFGEALLVKPLSHCLPLRLSISW